MRKIEMFEIKRLKCPVCGCRNKVYTELKDIHTNLIGYSIKCCSCGHYAEFFLEHTNDGRPHCQYQEGRRICIQPSFCPWRHECKLYRGDRAFAYHCESCPRYGHGDCHECIKMEDRNSPYENHDDDGYIKLVPIIKHFN